MRPISSKFSRPTTAKKIQKPEKVPPKSPQPGEDGDIVQLMQQLILSQKQCQKSGKYVQAQGFKRKVKVLQQQIQKRDLIDIKQKQEIQRKEIEQAHLEELNCFNIQWNQKMADLERIVHGMEEDLIGKHQEQLRLIQEEMEGEKPYRYKESAQLLNLKKIQQQLAKQQNYLQAHQVQARAQKLQKQQIQKWKQSQSSKNKTNYNVLKQKQQNQLNALKQRIDMMFDQKKLAKEQEEIAIMLKYQNVMKELEFQHKQELTKFQKAVKLKNVQKKTKIGLMSASKVSLS